MKKKFLILTAALALVVAQSTYAVAARSSSNSSDGTVTGPVTVIDRTSNGSGGGSTGGQTTPAGTTGLAATSVTDSHSATTLAGAVDMTNAVLGAVKSTVTSTGSTITTTTVALNTTSGVVATEAIAPGAAPEVSANDAAAAIAWVADKVVTTSSDFAGYAAGAAGAIQAVNANPAALATLPSGVDLSKYAMLTNFQVAVIRDAAGNIVDAQPGQCLAIEVPALVPGMKAYLAYVDPVTNNTVLIQISGVDFVNRLVYIDARYAAAAWSIVYEK